MTRFVCIHGHFYQPPRENPWLEEVELQEAAYPYHDWNDRITDECYAPNTASRIMDSHGRIIEIVNSYSKMSFDFGPTLLYWLERRAPEVYEAILTADRRSMERFSGHGSAIAQAYNHMIMPLANRRDKYTQVKWGVKDFEKRFERLPEGMWLPETSVDLETLEALAGLGIKFTILAPHQAVRVRKINGEDSFDVSGERIDPRIAYLCHLPSGNVINIFFYDRVISNEVAFGGLLRNGEVFAKRLLEAFTGEGDSPQLVNIATDGETYGHHHRFGDMALAYCLYYIDSSRMARITNYGEFLERSPPEYEVEIVENTSWACAHGVERWRSNCGCSTGANPAWSQEWRRPLRDSMDWLREGLASLFEEELSKYLKNPWEARDDYVTVVLDRSKRNVEDFLARHAGRGLSDEEKRIVLRLLEMQRHALLMFTSCGWFFDEISEIGSAQVMQYAARAMQLAKATLGVDLEPKYLSILQSAPSNIPRFKDGAKVFEMLVKPSYMDLMKVGVHCAVSSLFSRIKTKVSKVYCYKVSDEIYEAYQSGRFRLAIGRSRVSSEITWSKTIISFAVLWLGDHNVFGRARELMDDDAFRRMRDEIKSSFERGEIQGVIILMEKHFGANSFSLKDLFKDEQRKIIDSVLQMSVANVESYYRKIFDDNYPAMRFLKDIGITPPRALQASADIVIASEIRKALAAEEIDLELLEKLIEDAARFSITLDGGLTGLEASSRIALELERLLLEPKDVDKLEKIERLIGLLKRLPIQLDLWRSQNMVFSLGKRYYHTMIEKRRRAEEDAVRWLAAFEKLSEQLGIKIQL